MKLTLQIAAGLVLAFLAIVYLVANSLPQPPHSKL